MANMFNNSYNAGSSQFSGSQIGGGFVSNENFNSSNKPIRATIPYDQRKLAQVTIKQIITAPPPQPEEHLVIDNQEISQLAMMAQIQSIDIQSSHTTYKITDYTGSLDVKQWTNDNEPQGKQANLNEGTWVKIHGRIHHYNGRCSINAFDVVPITDFNEITHHFLEVIFAHLTNTTTQQQNTGNNNKNDHANNNNNQSMNYGNNNNNNNYGNNNQFNNNRNNTNQMNNYGNLPPVQAQILNIINKPEFENSDAGCNVEVLFNRLSNEDVNDIRQAIDDLANAGHIYSTVDDEHYKYSGDQ